MADNWDDMCDNTPTVETTHINSSNVRLSQIIVNHLTVKPLTLQLDSIRGRGQGFNKLENDWQQTNGQNEDNWTSNNNNQNDDNSKDTTDSKRKIFSNYLQTNVLFS